LSIKSWTSAKPDEVALRKGGYDNIQVHRPLLIVDEVALKGRLRQLERDDQSVGFDEVALRKGGYDNLTIVMKGTIMMKLPSRKGGYDNGGFSRIAADWPK
jgi:hypothetical protein